MQQLPLMDDISPEHIVNVATVPLRSPFRFPGGKTWLVPRIRRWMSVWRHAHGSKPAEFIEPFAGGGITGLTVAFEQLARHVIMAEIDEEIAAVWETMLHENKEDNVDWLAAQIIAFEPTPESVGELLSRLPLSKREVAFRTLVRNRVNHGGILAPGAGMLKHGEGGKGVKSRWYANTLKERALAIADARERVGFRHQDGFDVLREYQNRDDVVFFIDPPYTAGGKNSGRRLYTHYDVDHEALFQLAGGLTGDFLMTYSNTDEVHTLADGHGLDKLPVAMRGTHHAKMTELLIGPNLDWAR